MTSGYHPDKPGKPLPPPKPDFLKQAQALSDERDRLAEQVREFRTVLKRWTDLTDLDAQEYHKKYTCAAWACAVDCFSAAARDIMTKTTR